MPNPKMARGPLALDESIGIALTVLTWVALMKTRETLGKPKSNT